MTLIHLRSATTSLVARTDGDALPVVLHWGSRLPDGVGEDELVAAIRQVVTHSSSDEPMSRRLLPLGVDGWRLRPALAGSAADGTRFAPRFRTTRVDSDETTLRVEAQDPDAGLAVVLTQVIHPDGLLEMATEVRNSGETAYRLDACEASVPIPMEAVEILDLTGRWCGERAPQRLPLGMGTWIRECRHGRTGHDAPLALCVGDPGFGFRHGRVWALHLMWSGDSRLYAERSPVGRAQLGAGELLAAGEVVLDPGATYTAPPVLAAYSDRGLDGISAAFHGYVRARASHPRTPRPVLLNTWEAVYFDHRLDVLTALADRAADAGIERFVLDDGWFGSRRNDSRGLGDWVVSEEVWPDGLTPLIDHVRSRGMDFGIWVEPEMANPDSDLVRAHPEWVLHVPGREPMLWRRQRVIDLADSDCFAHILERLDTLLSDYAIAFVKWDHNRDLVDAAHDGRPAVRAQTLAAYALFDELRRRHPGVDFETCASGGGRVDLGILARTDRLWASDTIDALERQRINLWTSLVVPPELIGSHIGGPHSHTTGRNASFAMRAASAVFWHMGVEWNVSSLTDGELVMLRTAIEWHKAHRSLLHSGDVVRIDTPDRPLIVHGVVAGDRSEAVFSVARLRTEVVEGGGHLRLDGLDPAASYAVSPAFLGEVPSTQQLSWPEWVAHPGTRISGAVLMTMGLALPNLHPEQAILIHLRRD
ncbi:MAG: alpha-galactosidase [Dermatophilaceae bacterium]